MSFIFDLLPWPFNYEKELPEADDICKRQKHLINKQIKTGGIVLKTKKMYAPKMKVCEKSVKPKKAVVVNTLHEKEKF